MLVTALGIPMLWMGEEFGHSTGQIPNQPNKLLSFLLKNQPNYQLFILQTRDSAAGKSSGTLHEKY